MSLCSKICLNSSQTEAQSANKDPWLPSIWYVPGIVLTSLIIITVSLLISLLFSKLKKKRFKFIYSSKISKEVKKEFPAYGERHPINLNTSNIRIPFPAFIVSEVVSNVTQMRCPSRKTPVTGILNFYYQFPFWCTAVWLCKVYIFSVLLFLEVAWLALETRGPEENIRKTKSRKL